MSSETLAMLPVWYVVFLLSVTCHEAAHAYAAYRGGDPTAYLGGQVSLNPLPHIQREFFGTVVVPLLCYLLYGAGGNRWMLGWASAPYDPSWEDRHPRRAALMAAAGPLANLALGSIAFVVLKVGIGRGIWTRFYQDGVYLVFDRLVTTGLEQPGLSDGVGRFFSTMLTLNIVLFFFNLLPIPPMDGASVLSGFFEPARRLRIMMATTPMYSLIGLVIAWQLFPKLFFPIYAYVLSWL